MSFSKRQGTDVVCYTKPIVSLKGWNDHFFWIDAFACLALFSWHTGKSVSRDVIPKYSKFSPEHYATLVAYPAPFHKCLFYAKIDLMSFIRTADPTKVRIGERQRDEDEPKLLETIIRHLVPLLSIAPDRSSGELEASVDKLFDEKGNGEQAEQGDSSSGGHGVGIDVVAETIVEDMAPADDYGVLVGPTVCGKSQSSIQRLLAGAVQNTESVRMEITLKRFFISSNSSDHLAVNIAKAKVDSVVRTSMPIITSANTTTPIVDPAAIAKEKLVGSSVFGADSPSAGGSHPIYGGFSDCSGSDFLVGEAARVVRLRAETSKLEAAEKSLRDKITTLNECNTILKKERNALDVKVTDLQAVVVSKDRELTDSDAQLTSIKAHNDNLADQVTLYLEERFYPHLLTTIAGHRWLLTHGMELAISKCLNSPEYLSGLGTAVSKAIEKGMQDGFAAGITHGREGRVLTDVDAHNPVSSFELKEKLSNYKNLTKRLEEFQDAQLKVVNDKFDKLYADFVEVTLHLEEWFYPHLLTTIVGRRWLVTHGMELAIAKCLNSPEYLSALGIVDRKAIEKAEENYVSALQQLQSVNFSLLAELKTNKDASVKAVMNILRLEEHLAARYFWCCAATADLSTALSVTLASADTVTPLSVDDYDVMGTNDQSTVNESVVDEDTNPFPNVDDAELNIPQ
nr:hypothetical protein [Tanacetum cinerariifolium]